MNNSTYLKIQYSFILDNGCCIDLCVKSYNKKIIEDDFMFIVAMEQELYAYDFINGKRANFSLN